jgi:hypothetical protein
MKSVTYSLEVKLPSIEEFSKRFPQYGNYARGEGNFLYERIVSPDCFNYARVATVELKLPAVAGIAEICYQLVKNKKNVEWTGFIKHYIGAVVCTLMEANGFNKTGQKKSVPHSDFTKGEFYLLE